MPQGALLEMHRESFCEIHHEEHYETTSNKHRRKAARGVAPRSQPRNAARSAIVKNIEALRTAALTVTRIDTPTLVAIYNSDSTPLTNIATLRQPKIGEGGGNSR